MLKNKLLKSELILNEGHSSEMAMYFGWNGTE